MSHSPYTDLSRPPLSQPALSRALVTPEALWRRLEVVAETGSTNADAVAAARGGDAAGTVIIAESQTAGRGRLNRRWEAPPRSSIMLSVVLRPSAPASRWGWLPLLAGVAVAEAVARVAVVDAALKWPNDLLIREADDPQQPYAKAAGVLAEVVPERGCVVVGIGLNVSQHAEELPPPTPGALPATSLALIGAASTDRDPLVRAVLRRVEAWYRQWEDAAGSAEQCGLRAAYEELCATVGTEVVVSLPDGAEVAGVARAVDADGRLVVRTPHGDRVLAAGDVRHVR